MAVVNYLLKLINPSMEKAQFSHVKIKDFKAEFEKRVEIITALKFAQVCQTSRKSSKGASKVCKLQQIVKMWLLPLLITIYTRAIQIAGSWLFRFFRLNRVQPNLNW